MAPCAPATRAIAAAVANRPRAAHRRTHRVHLIRAGGIGSERRRGGELRQRLRRRRRRHLLRIELVGVHRVGLPIDRCQVGLVEERVGQHHRFGIVCSTGGGALSSSVAVSPCTGCKLSFGESLCGAAFFKPSRARRFTRRRRGESCSDHDGAASPGGATSAGGDVRQRRARPRSAARRANRVAEAQLGRRPYFRAGVPSGLRRLEPRGRLLRTIRPSPRGRRASPLRHSR